MTIEQKAEFFDQLVSGGKIWNILKLTKMRMDKCRSDRSHCIRYHFTSAALIHNQEYNRWKSIVATLESILEVEPFIA